MDFPRGMMEFAIPAAQAHEKWFVPISPVTYEKPSFYQTLNPYTIGALLAVLTFAVLGHYANQAYRTSDWGKRMEAKFRPWRDYAAGILAFTTGLMLFITAMRGQLIAANYPLPDGVPGLILQYIEYGVGVLLMIGLFTPVAAAGILALYFSTFAFHPFIEPIDYVNFVGIALFLVTFSRGRYSLDWFLGKPILSTPQQRKWAYVFLRSLTGFTLLWLALLKWRRPDLHLVLMDQYPNFNPYVLLQWLGIKMSREMYVFLLSIVEATVGICELFGYLTRLAAMLLVPIFLGSIMFLGPSELVGHLPLAGTLFVLIIYGDDYYRNREPDRYAAHDSQKVETVKA